MTLVELVATAYIVLSACISGSNCLNTTLHGCLETEHVQNLPVLTDSLPASAACAKWCTILFAAWQDLVSNMQALQIHCLKAANITAGNPGSDNPRWRGLSTHAADKRALAFPDCF